MRLKRRNLNCGGATRRLGRWYAIAGAVLVTFHVSRFTLSPARAAPTQEDVFKSIQDNVSDSADWSGLLPFALAGAGVLLVVAVVSQRRTQSARQPRKLNHSGKLMREVLDAVPLRPAEVRQLKLLAEDAAAVAGGGAIDPVTLLACPSLLARSIRARQSRGGRMDRKAVTALARKVGVTREMVAGAAEGPGGEARGVARA
jgi:hypothetical protein